MRFFLKTDYAQDLRLVKRGDQAASYGVGAAIMLGLPWLIVPYWLSQVSFILIYAVAGLGLMLLAGYTGLISIGHAAFLGIGAYAEAFLVARNWPFATAIISAGLLSAAAGVAIGLPALRVKRIYLAIATLAFGFVAGEVMARWEYVTGGNTGVLVGAPGFLGWQLRSQVSLYYLSLTVCLLVTLGVVNLLRSSTGRAFIAIRDSEVSAQSMGIQLARYKTLSFSLSAGIVGLAGALYAHKLRFISPEQFSISQSIDLLLLVVVGGLGSLPGAFFGAIFIITMPQLISLAKDFLPPAIGQAAGLQAVVFGAVLIAFVLFEPLGIHGRWVKVRTYWELFPLYRQGTFRRQKAYQKSDRFK